MMDYGMGSLSVSYQKVGRSLFFFGAVASAMKGRTQNL
jgi:hypothetical protein